MTNNIYVNRLAFENKWEELISLLCNSAYSSFCNVMDICLLYDRPDIVIEIHDRFGYPKKRAALVCKYIDALVKINPIDKKKRLRSIDLSSGSLDGRNFLIDSDVEEWIYEMDAKGYSFSYTISYLNKQDESIADEFQARLHNMEIIPFKDRDAASIWCRYIPPLIEQVVVNEAASVISRITYNTFCTRKEYEYVHALIKRFPSVRDSLPIYQSGLFLISSYLHLMSRDSIIHGLKHIKHNTDILDILVERNILTWKEVYEYVATYKMIKGNDHIAQYVSERSGIDIPDPGYLLDKDNDDPCCISTEKRQCQRRYRYELPNGRVYCKRHAWQYIGRKPCIE